MSIDFFPIKDFMVFQTINIKFKLHSLHHINDFSQLTNLVSLYPSMVQWHCYRGGDHPPLDVLGAVCQKF